MWRDLLQNEEALHWDQETPVLQKPTNRAPSSRLSSQLSAALLKQLSAQGGQLELHDQICQMLHKVPRQSLNHLQHLYWQFLCAPLECYGGSTFWAGTSRKWVWEKYQHMINWVECWPQTSVLSCYWLFLQYSWTHSSTESEDCVRGKQEFSWVQFGGKCTLSSSGDILPSCQSVTDENNQIQASGYKVLSEALRQLTLTRRPVPKSVLQIQCQFILFLTVYRDFVYMGGKQINGILPSTFLCSYKRRRMIIKSRINILTGEQH